MKPILTAFRFLTILPLPSREMVTERELGRAVGFYPLVGLVLGGVLALTAWAASLLFPPSLVAALTLTAWVAFSAALHVDGFLDACDGLFGGNAPEMRLAIMRDERIGAFAFTGGALLFLGKYAALTALLQSPTSSAFGLVSLFQPWLLLAPAPILGRFAMSLAIVHFPYAREQGLGRAMKDHARMQELALAAGLALFAVAGLLAWAGVGLWLATVLFTWLLGRWTLRRLPGLTGDIYGALCELTELLVLILLIGFG
ncbi:MAG: adenosylcobinamide-GDP ribazoletransferase [Chloroflexi bacterium]|nr:adenosylcobinamide-GDP ribazoletransferase [Chloroflexota bacterium]